jgi:Protein of unknown function (DUF1236)
MQSGVRVALLTSVWLSLPAQAQVGAIEPYRAPAVTADTRHPALPDFSMQQRAAIFRAIMEQHSPPTVPFDLEVGIGTILPNAIETHALPAPVLAQIPAAAKYNYAIWRDQVLVTEAGTRRVADILHGYILRDQR